MTTFPLLFATLWLFTAGGTPPLLAQHPAMPEGMTHAEHLAQMKKDNELKQRGATAMGFDQEKTSHHFLLNPKGGSIEVTANDASDDETRNQVRSHLKEIAAAFSRGNFDKPFATHNEVPPGVRTMQLRRRLIVFEYQETPAGARVLMSSGDPKATAALHTFLRYQIREHATGDPLSIPA